MGSPYLDRTKRSFDQAMAEREDKKHRQHLGELLEWLQYNDTIARNAPGVDRFELTRARRISAVKYAIEALNNAAAKRVLAPSEDR